MEMQKKAVSALVATVLLILITVAAVGIIWGAIMPMINQATQYGQACMNARFQINTQAGYTCRNASGLVSVHIERGAEDFSAAGIQLVVSGGGLSRVFLVKDKQGNQTVGEVLWQIPNNYSNRPNPPCQGCGIFDVPNTNEARTYVINSGLTTTSEVSVAPVVKVGNTEKTCDITSRAALSPCTAV